MSTVRWALLLVSLTEMAAAATVASTVTLATSGNPSILGKALMLTATVAPTSATGEVTFYDGATPLGRSALSTGSAALSTLALGPGVHSLSAYYAGDSATSASSSAATPQTVLGLGQNGFQKPATYQGVEMPFGVAVGDFNKDGILDLVVANGVQNTVGVMLGKGDGTFNGPTNFQVATVAGSFPAGIVVSDFNGDGFQDIAVVNAATVSNTVAVLIANGPNSFRPFVSYPVPGNPHSLAFCDFNGDGIGDLVTDNFLNSSVSVLLGNPDGTFQSPRNITVGLSPISTTCGDINGDGKADIVVANQNQVSVLLGKGDASFQNATNYSFGTTNPGRVAIGDFNRDGHADLAVANGSNVSILIGKGDAAGTLQAPVNYAVGNAPYEIVTGDFNGDGLPDLAVSNAADNDVSILLGKGDGTFQTQVTYPAGTGPRPMAAGDFMGNGRSGLAVGDYFGSTLDILLAVPVDEPVIEVVVNGASFASSGLSPGLIFTVAGTGMGPGPGATAVLDSHGRIASTNSGVEVLVDGTPAPLLFVRQDQINAVAPYELVNRVGQNVNVQLMYNGTPSNILSIPIAATSPAIFSLGNGQGAIRNQDQSVNGASNPAAVGSFVSIYATGEGQINPGGMDGQLVTDAGTVPVGAVSLTIGGVAVVPQFAGSTEFEGFFQVNAQVPPGVTGVVPVVVTVGGKASPNGITMAVQ